MLPRRQFGACLGGLALAAHTREASAHPYHGTLTQALHNQKQGTLECSMRVDPDALQAALRHAGSPKLQLDNVEPAQLDRLCDAYLRKRVIVCNRVPKRLPLSLVGHELDLKHAWLHFAFPVGKVKNLEGYHFEFRVFFEIAPAQVNRVQLEHGGLRQTLLFRAEHPSELISLPAG